MSDKRKLSLYFPQGMLDEMEAEAVRLDRSMSWLAQRAWTIARGEIHQYPSIDDVELALGEEAQWKS